MGSRWDGGDVFGGVLLSALSLARDDLSCHGHPIYTRRHLILDAQVRLGILRFSTKKARGPNLCHFSHC